jgi:hypothetical protein
MLVTMSHQHAMPTYAPQSIVMTGAQQTAGVGWHPAHPAHPAHPSQPQPLVLPPQLSIALGSPYSHAPRVSQPMAHLSATTAAFNTAAAYPWHPAAHAAGPALLGQQHGFSPPAVAAAHFLSHGPLPSGVPVGHVVPGAHAVPVNGPIAFNVVPLGGSGWAVGAAGPISTQLAGFPAAGPVAFNLGAQQPTAMQPPQTPQTPQASLGPWHTAAAAAGVGLCGGGTATFPGVPIQPTAPISSMHEQPQGMPPTPPPPLHLQHHLQQQDEQMWSRATLHRQVMPS